MNKLTIINQNGILVTDSREVAERTKIRHTDLLRKIKGYKETIDQNAKLRSANFFIESSYKNENNQSYPCYLLTKLGCDMVANKMTGEKGVLFTAEYVTEFEAMKETIGNNNSLQLQSADMSKQIAEIVQAEVQTEIQRINTTCSQYYKPTATDKFNASRYIKTRLGIVKANDEYEAVKQRLFFILGVKTWESIPIEVLKNSLNIIDESIRVIKADRPQKISFV